MSSWQFQFHENRESLASWTLSPCSEVDEIEGVTHCKGPIQKIRKTYSQKRNCAPQSQFLHSCVCELFIYSHDRSAYSAAGKYVDRSWVYINRLQTHECGNWVWGRAIPRKGIHKCDFCCSADSTVAPGMNTTPYNLTKWSHFGQSTHTFQPQAFFTKTGYCPPPAPRTPPSKQTNKRNVVSWCILPVVSIHAPSGHCCASPLIPTPEMLQVSHFSTLCSTFLLVQCQSPNSQSSYWKLDS
jgi:hypothetical protein